LTGSAGLEAILLGKPVATLGRPYYSVMPCVRLMDYPDEIWRLLKDRSWLAGAASDQRETWIAAYLQALTHLGPVEYGKIWPRFDVAAPSFAAGLRRTIEFIEVNRLKPSDFDPGWKFSDFAECSPGTQTVETVSPA
jgi:hypothetical protein